MLLIDINMPDFNGFELCQKMLELDVNVRVCLISAGEINVEALREIRPKDSKGFVTISVLKVDFTLM
jgi:DNA-binding response OmpR family regulator